MRVCIHAKSIRLTIPVPNILAFNHVVSLVVSGALRKCEPCIHISPKQFDDLWAAVRKAHRNLGKIPLVQVCTQSGDEVLITL